MTNQSFARHLPTVARLLMGLMFLVFGLNGFLHFIPQPKDGMPPGAMAFFGALVETHYMIPLIFGTQTFVGVLLLVNCYVPLALALIAPVIVNIIGFHLSFAPSSIGPGIFVLILELYLAWSYRRFFIPMLTCKARPGG